MEFSKIIFILLTTVLLTSCATKKVAFTSDIQKEHNFPEVTLKRIQFYTSSEILLVRVKQDGEVRVTDGKLILENNKDIERIVIKKNTPCVLEQIVDGNKFLFSFEYGNEKVLLFGNNGDGYFSLMSKNWKNGVGVITYANRTYATTNGNVYLMIQAKNLNKLKAKQRTVGGRKV